MLIRFKNTRETERSGNFSPCCDIKEAMTDVAKCRGRVARFEVAHGL
jgi:hypothetical protein